MNKEEEIFRGSIQMRFTMNSEDKSTMDSQPVIIIPAPQQDARSLESSKKRKKYVIIAATGIIALVVILASILIGMYLFTEAQKDILKFTLKLDSDKDQEVVSDPNTNIVKYHIQEKDYDAWIINDYNKGLTVMRIQKESDINCYVTPFNNSKDLDLSDIQLSSAPPLLFRTSVPKELFITGVDAVTASTATAISTGSGGSTTGADVTNAPSHTTADSGGNTTHSTATISPVESVRISI